MIQIDRQHARRCALAKREELVHEIRLSHATAEERAFMEQKLAHLWQFVEEAMDLGDQPVYPTLMSCVKEQP